MMQYETISYIVKLKTAHSELMRNISHWILRKLPERYPHKEALIAFQWSYYMSIFEALVKEIDLTISSLSLLPSLLEKLIEVDVSSIVGLFEIMFCDENMGVFIHRAQVPLKYMIPMHMEDIKHLRNIESDLHTEIFHALDLLFVQMAQWNVVVTSIDVPDTVTTCSCMEQMMEALMYACHAIFNMINRQCPVREGSSRVTNRQLHEGEFFKNVQQDRDTAMIQKIQSLEQTPGKSLISGCMNPKGIKWQLHHNHRLWLFYESISILSHDRDIFRLRATPITMSSPAAESAIKLLRNIFEHDSVMIGSICTYLSTLYEMKHYMLYTHSQIKSDRNMEQLSMMTLAVSRIDHCIDIIHTLPCRDIAIADDSQTLLKQLKPLENSLQQSLCSLITCTLQYCKYTINNTEYDNIAIKRWNDMFMTYTDSVQSNQLKLLTLIRGTTTVEVDNIGTDVHAEYPLILGLYLKHDIPVNEVTFMKRLLSEVKQRLIKIEKETISSIKHDIQWYKQHGVKGYSESDYNHPSTIRPSDSYTTPTYTMSDDATCLHPSELSGMNDIQVREKIELYIIHRHNNLQLYCESLYNQWLSLYNTSNSNNDSSSDNSSEYKQHCIQLYKLIIQLKLFIMSFIDTKVNNIIYNDCIPNKPDEWDGDKVDFTETINIMIFAITTNLSLFERRINALMNVKGDDVKVEELQRLKNLEVLVFWLSKCLEMNYIRFIEIKSWRNHCIANVYDSSNDRHTSIVYDDEFDNLLDTDIFQDAYRMIVNDHSEDLGLKWVLKESDLEDMLLDDDFVDNFEEEKEKTQGIMIELARRLQIEYFDMLVTELENES